MARWKIDKSLLLVLFFFLGLGLVQVYSASFILAMEKYGDGHYFFRRQLIFTALGLLALFVGSQWPIRWLEKGAWLLWLVSFLLLVMTFIPGYGVKVGGAQRWLRLPFEQRMEPAELVKLVLPLILAQSLTYLSQKFSYLRLIERFLLIGVPLGILLFQPDFGTFVICLLVIFCLLFVYGLKWRYVGMGVAVAVPALYFLVINVAYRRDRLLSYLDPWSDPAQKGFQVIQSMLAFSNGGLSGEGLGQGQGKLFFLPEAHTDFTLAVLGEETGFIGYLVILMLYGLLVFKGLQISLQTKKMFLQLVTLGWTLMFGFSVFINVGVVLGFLPTKGLTLPFLSYGGSSLIITCLGFGWLINVDHNNRLQEERE